MAKATNTLNYLSKSNCLYALSKVLLKSYLKHRYTYFTPNTSLYFLDYAPHLCCKERIMRVCLLLFILCACNSIAQNSFEKYGMFGSTVYTELSEALKIKKDVYKLDLSYKTVEQKAFDKISQLHELQALLLSSNNLNKWPDHFSSLTNLVYLTSLNNPFKGWPKNIGNLGNLMHLELLGSQIDSIPQQLTGLHRLKTLRISYTNDTLGISPEIKKIVSLQELSIEGCILDSCPKLLFRIPGLKFLSLPFNQIQAIPESLNKCAFLEVLILDNNQLNTLPRDIYKCSKLIHLSLKNNHLHKLPDTICHLKQLTHLDLRGNPIDQAHLEELKALLPGCVILH